MNNNNNNNNNIIIITIAIIIMSFNRINNSRIVGYGTNDNRLRVEKEGKGWIFCHSNRKYLHRTLLPEINQFS